jgi:hypothetical protein
MSDIEHDDHEEIARRLREDGQAQAPPDLVGEVMKRVRSEPRRSTSAVRRPLVTLLAASLVTVALVAGLAKLGGGGSGSAVGGASGSEAHAPGTSGGKQGPAEVVESKRVAGVPKSALPNLTFNGTTLDALGDATPGACPADAFIARKHFTVSVPYSAWGSVQAQLDSAKLLPYTSPLVTVQLHRLAPGVALRLAITCP